MDVRVRSTEFGFGSPPLASRTAEGESCRREIVDQDLYLWRSLVLSASRALYSVRNWYPLISSCSYEILLGFR